MFCSRRVTYFHVLKFERKKIKVPELFTICYESVTITKALCNQSSLCFESTPCVISLSCLEKESKHRLLPDTNLTLEFKKNGQHKQSQGAERIAIRIAQKRKGREK